MTVTSLFLRGYMRVSNPSSLYYLCSDARFPDARFSDARFPDARFSDARFPDARFSDARFPDVRFLTR